MQQAKPECLPASSELAAQTGSLPEFCYALCGLWFLLLWVGSVFCEKGHLDKGVGLDLS